VQIARAIIHAAAKLEITPRSLIYLKKVIIGCHLIKTLIKKRIPARLEFDAGHLGSSAQL
jgi:hypothetical protein